MFTDTMLSPSSPSTDIVAVDDAVSLASSRSVGENCASERYMHSFVDVRRHSFGVLLLFYSRVCVLRVTAHGEMMLRPHTMSHNVPTYERVAENKRQRRILK